MKPIRYGIVGVGGFGAKRRQILRECGCFEIVGGVDVKPESFTQADKEEGRPLRRFSSVEELAADPSIEAIFIATPAQLHVDQALIAARAGKAVFVEKPLGHDWAACKKLVEYCEQNNIPHGHGFGSRFSPLWQHVKTILDAGTLGTIWRVPLDVAGIHGSGLLVPHHWLWAVTQSPRQSVCNLENPWYAFRHRKQTHAITPSQDQRGHPSR